MLSAVS
jgi:dynein heavy chain 1